MAFKLICHLQFCTMQSELAEGLDDINLYIVYVYVDIDVETIVF